MEPLVLSFWIFIGVSAATWLLSVVTREYSWTDRVWSIAPVVYAWVFAATAPGNTRLVIMAVLVTLWGARLTFNFARKGGFARGGEDYRWKVLQSRMKPWQYQIFNLFFVAFYQNLIVFAIVLPAYTAWQHDTAPGPLDIVATVLFLAFLIGETVADQQQWNFHRRKAAGQASARFLTTGLFRFSRHPNFFCEQAQWVHFYAFGAIAARSPFEWTGIGVVLLILLFLGSYRFTESITLSKYPEYAEYQRTTSAQLPWFPRRQQQPASALSE